MPTPLRLLLVELADIAAAKGAAFHSGAFVCADPERELWMLLNESQLYSRVSSHLKHLPGGQPDMFGADFDEVLFCGDSKSTLLFASIELNGVHCVFAKPEEHGMQGGASIVGHAGTYVTTTLLGRTGEDKVLRKERVPSAYKARFVELLQAQGGDAESSDAHRAQKQGVFAMLRELGAYGSGPVLQMQAFVEQDLGTVAAIENHFRQRVGREVFMSAGEVASAVRRVRETIAESPRARSRSVALPRDPSLFAGLPEELRVHLVLEQAYDLRNTSRWGDQEPYAILTMGEHVLRTAADKEGGGAEAAWREHMVFRARPQDLHHHLHVCVRRKGLTGSKLIGEGSAELHRVHCDGEEHPIEVQLMTDGVDDSQFAGIVVVRVRVANAPTLPATTPRPREQVANIGRQIYIASLTNRAIAKMRRQSDY